MKIAIISDTHDNLVNLKNALAWIMRQGISIIIHCGDLNSPEALKTIFHTGFKGEIYLVGGNADMPNLEKEIEKIEKNKEDKGIKELKYYESIGKIKIQGIKIGFTHFPDIARELANSQNFDFVFYGHSHRPWQEEVGKTSMINPGNVAGIFYRPSFAVLNTKTKEVKLKILEKLDLN